MSTITHVSSLTADEINADPMPMKIQLNQAKIVLQDDGVPSYPTNPGTPEPLTLNVPRLTVNRTHDGVFHITGKFLFLGSVRNKSNTELTFLHIRTLHPEYCTKMLWHLKPVMFGSVGQY